MFLLSEREIRRNGFKLFCLRLNGCFMDRISIDEDGLIGFCRTCMFTSAATDTDLIFDFRYQEPSLKRYHMACFGGTVFRACPACCLFSIDNTVILDEYSLTELGQFLGFNHQGHYGSCGAYISATVTVIIAEASVKIHPWLHDAGKPVFAD